MTGIQWPPVPRVFSPLKIDKSLQMTQRKFSMKKMALKSNFGFTTVNHYYTEDERQVGRQSQSVCGAWRHFMLRLIKHLQSGGALHKQPHRFSAYSILSIQLLFGRQTENCPCLHRLLYGVRTVQSIDIA